MNQYLTEEERKQRLIKDYEISISSNIAQIRYLEAERDLINVKIEGCKENLIYDNLVLGKLLGAKNVS